MTLLASVVGYLAIAGLALGMGGLGVSFVVDAFVAARARRDDLVRRLTYREIGQRLGEASWWFSENTDAMEAIAEVAKPMRRGVDPLQAVDEAREEWRKKHRERSA